MFSLDCTVTSQNGNLKADYFLSAQKSDIVEIGFKTVSTVSQLFLAF